MLKSRSTVMYQGEIAVQALLHPNHLFLRECIILEAERAALVARAECLKQNHDLEEQVERLRKRKEKMDIDAEIAASTAKLSVLKTFEQQT